MVQQAARRGDQHVHAPVRSACPARQRPRRRSAAPWSGGCIWRKCRKFSATWAASFACGPPAQGCAAYARARRPRPRRVIIGSVKEAVLPGPGLGNAQNITAFQRVRNCFCPEWGSARCRPASSMAFRTLGSSFRSEKKGHMRPSDTASGRYLFWDALIPRPAPTPRRNRPGWPACSVKQGLGQSLGRAARRIARKSAFAALFPCLAGA